MKSQIETFHELLPGNLVFFHFYYNGTKEIELLDHTTELYRKNYTSMENYTSGVQNLTKTFCDQTVTRSFKIEVLLHSLLLTDKSM